MGAIKKLFRHGGSYAVDIPMEFVKKTGVKEVTLEYTSKGLIIQPKNELDSMESDPLFAKFIQALAIDALENPQKLHDVKEVWDDEWNSLLKGVSANGE